MLAQQQRRALGTLPGGDDGGFSLLEVIVAIAVMAAVMAGLTSLFVGSSVVTSQQGSRQVAAQLASDGIDEIRARSTEAIALLIPDPDNNGSDLPVLNNPAYSRRVFVHKCLQSTTTAQWCGSTGATRLAFYRVKIVVTWSDRSCWGSSCEFSVTALVNASQDETLLPVAFKPQTAPADGAWLA